MAYLIVLILNLRTLNMEYRIIRRILNKQRTVGFKLNKFLEFGMKYIIFNDGTPVVFQPG